MKVTPWTLQRIIEFREWHEETILRLYHSDPVLIHELRQDREQWFIMVMPRTQGVRMIK